MSYIKKEKPTRPKPSDFTPHAGKERLPVPSEQNAPMRGQEDIKSYNVGASDYSKRTIQPWMIWEEYHLNPWDADIIKRILRNKDGEDESLDYEKIIHICKKRLEQIEAGYKF